MDEYKEPYLVLWRGIDEALAAMAEQNYGLAAERLKQAQADAEEAYIEQEN